MLSQLPTWNKHRTTCCNTIAYSPPLQPPTSHPVVCPFVQPGSTTAAAVPFQVARAKLSINSRKVVNIQTRDSPLFIISSFTGLEPAFLHPSAFAKKLHPHLHVNRLECTLHTRIIALLVAIRWVRSHGSHYTTAPKSHKRRHTVVEHPLAPWLPSSSA